MSRRAKLAAEAARLKAEGLNGIQIGKRMGIGRSYAYELLSDPDGVAVRVRKAAQGGRCADCGGVTSYGTGGPPERCLNCTHAKQRRDARERCLSEIRRYVAKYGRTPTACDWNPSLARASCSPLHAQVIADRYEREGWPPTSQVVSAFGGWNAAIKAAGFEPRRQGHRGPNWRTDRAAA